MGIVERVPILLMWWAFLALVAYCIYRWIRRDPYRELVAMALLVLWAIKRLVCGTAAWLTAGGAAWLASLAVLAGGAVSRALAVTYQACCIELTSIAQGLGSLTNAIADPEADVDWAASTDGEDLACIAGDIFEFGAQDAILLIDQATLALAAVAVSTWSFWQMLGALAAHKPGAASMAARPFRLTGAPVRRSPRMRFYDTMDFWEYHACHGPRSMMRWYDHPRRVRGLFAPRRDRVASTAPIRKAYSAY